MGKVWHGCVMIHRHASTRLSPHVVGASGLASSFKPTFSASPSSAQKGVRAIRRSLKRSVKQTAADFSLTADTDQNDISA
ncbi:hypothetical protein QQF64_022374 [Cirrhinus molitorella]|uniref:Uncharacterized protein n=1 Tax=Cirrhinus molitorella TaxID=172907 RepID=A0ABR3LAN3_9TELE